MAQMMDMMPEKPESEKVFYTCVANNLPKDILCYHNREVNGMEFDYCLLIKNIGIVIVEVKGWRYKDIINVNSPDEIYTTIYNEPQRSPKKQANAYRFNLINILKKKYGINPLVLDMVCYPYMSAAEYRQCGLNIVSEETVTLFREDIESNSAFAKKIIGLYHSSGQMHYDKMNNQLFNIIRGHFEHDVVDDISEEIPYSELSIFTSRLSLSSVEKIINSYFFGVKQIVFVRDREDMQIIASNLSDRFKAENIAISGNGLVMDADGNHIVNADGDKFGVFLFDCYLIEDLKDICSKEIHIVDGLYGENGELLKTISQKTSFNFSQYKVEHAPIDKHIVVKAGAGTGKTFSMISRISYVCHVASKSHVAIPSEEIAMLTFTDEAANNMKNRLKAQFENYFILTKNVKHLDRITDIERMRISTIHSFAKEIMKNTTLPLGIGADFATVNGNFERAKILRRVLNEYLEKKNKADPSFVFNLPLPSYELQKFLLRFIDVMQNKGFDITQATEESLGQCNQEDCLINELILEVAKKAEEEYERCLIENNQVNLKQYIILLNKCISDESFNKKLYSYKFVFIDEFQDVDDAQIIAFLELQKKLNFRFFIVGDLKQSIYRFRGATMDAFTKMGCSTADWEEYALNINYRSDKRLLKDFEPLFEELGKDDYLLYDKVKDVLIGVRENENITSPLIQKIDYTDKALSEPENLYDKLFKSVSERKAELSKLSQSKKLSPAEKTIAILVRTNSQVGSVLRAARVYEINVESDTSDNLYQLQSTLDLCKLTSALINPYNQLYLFDLLSSNNVNVKFPLKEFVGLDEEKHVSKITGYLDDYFKRTMGLTWLEIIEQAQTMPILMVLRNIYESTMPWKNFSDNPEKQAFYRANYEMVFEQLSKANARNYLTLDSVNQSLLIAISANLESSSRRLVDEYDGVKIICTTIHKSKGLEYDSVYLPFTDDTIGTFKKNSIEANCVDDKLGYYVTLNNEEIYNNYFNYDSEVLESCKEEARVLYVAMTRAINKVVWFNNGMRQNMSWSTYLGRMPVCQ